MTTVKHKQTHSNNSKIKNTVAQNLHFSGGGGGSGGGRFPWPQI
jgi:uncharacterized membrane protein YgcG